jgi:hypothetical protein
LPEALRREEREARAAEARAVRELRAPLPATDRAVERARRIAQVDAARERVARVVARIQREARTGATLLHPQAAPLEAIRGVLAADEALVLYALDGARMLACVATRGEARLVDLGPVEPIAEATRALDLQRPGGHGNQSLATLAALVATPLRVPPGAQRVLISPAGHLCGVPGGLLFPDRTVAYVPSGTVLRLLREQPVAHGEGVLALGDPDYGGSAGAASPAVARGAPRLRPLPATRDEALAVGTVVLLGGEATEPALRAALARPARWRAVHLACHGLVDARRPALSSLALTAAGEDDGFLTCLDIFRLRMPADLAVLSACETARGEVVSSEGIVGLTRAFLVAGTPRVICSLWRVDDEATAALMTRFYALWSPKDGTPGLGAARALREAQAFVAAQARWKHPFYWAAWVLWGLPE